jgi:predicted ATPase/transcriptional regulator with XRE-family HTH domain
MSSDRGDESPGFGELLRQHRLAAGLTQEELAERAGLSERGISDLERGARNRPHRATVGLLADALGLRGVVRTTFVRAAPRSIGHTAARSERAAAQFPLPMAPLIGRQQERVGLTALLRDGPARLVTLTGPGGVGKTRLAIEVASELANVFAEGVWFVPLDPLREPGLVVPAIAQALGLREMGGRHLRERLTDYLHGRHMLLVLDNFEHVVAAAPDVAVLLTTCSQLSVLVTSRDLLHLSGEHSFPVPPLTLPDPRAVSSPADLMAFEAIRLFLARAEAIQPGFALTEANATTVATICARLDGLPLAIELAAARVGHLPLGALLERLVGTVQHPAGLGVLTGGVRDLPGRLRTMRDAIAWSHDLLSLEEQHLFRQLAVFRGGFTLDAVEAVGTELGGDREVFDLVSSLVDKSLLRREEREDVPRYRMLETVREFGLEQLVTSNELEAARREHGMYFLALAELAAPALWGPEPGAWLDRLETERDNLREALIWAHEQHATELECRLAIALQWFWRSRGPVGEGRRWTEALLADTLEVAPALRAALLMGAGHLAMTQGEFARAAELHEASIALARELGDQPTLAHALLWRGATAVYEGQFDLGQEIMDQVINVASLMGAPFWHAWALTILATIARGRGEHAHASALLAESNAICQAERIAWPTALNFSLMSEIATDLGELDRAEALGREGVRLAWEVGERRYFAGALAGLARAVAARGDSEWGARLYGAVDAVLEATGANFPVMALLSFEPARAAVHAALGEARFAAAWSAGHALPPLEVLAEAEHGMISTGPAADDTRTERSEAPSR